MGCDIHMVLEQKTDNGWVGLHAFPHLSGDTYYRAPGATESTTIPIDWLSLDATGRNYGLFSKLADVRSENEGDGPAPKGLPKDASALTLLELSEEDSDLHSHTWWMLDEALPIFMGHQMPEKILEDQRRHLAMRMFGLWEGENDAVDYRLYIAFDN